MTKYASIKDRLETCSIRQDNGCIEWSKSLCKEGYGRFAIREDGKVKYIFTHRASYNEYKGTIPEGMCVCHTCDNRKCINPDHLWLGTKTDNNKDRAMKGRSSRSGKAFGDKHGIAKLSSDDVMEIKHQLASYKKGMYKQLSQKFGVCLQTICNIANGKNWRHVK